MRTPSFYKSAQWTADGTTVITSSYHDQICSFVVPSDLLEPREEPLTLRPQGVLNLATSTNVVTPAPYFDLLNPHTHHVLVACRDHPIQIFQALPTNHDINYARSGAPQGSSSLYSYRLISPQTEAYLPVHSLAWPGSHMSTSFFVGSTNLIAQFDLHRVGEGPRQRVHTIPSKRHISKGNGVGMRGTVSALSMQTDASSAPTGLLAGGTWTRWVGLYDFARGGERTATWGIAGAAGASVAAGDPPPGSGHAPAPGYRHSSRGRTPVRGIGGEGVSQTAWSPDGRYLLVSERQSTGVLVYDARVTSRLLGFLAGRDALTHQRLDLAVYPGPDGTGGFEVWAGTRDGTVKVWQGVGGTEGCLWPSWDFPAMVGGGGGSGGDDDDDDDDKGGSPVGSVALHPSGSVAATCTGCWSLPGGDDDGDSDSSSSSSSSSSSGEDPDGDETSDTTLSSSGSNLSRCVWRPDNKRIEESSLKLWSIGFPTYDAALDTPQGEATEMDVSQADMPEVDADSLEPSEVIAAQTDESWYDDASQMDTLQTGAIEVLDRGHSDSQVDAVRGEEAEATQDDALQKHILQMSTPEKR